MYLKEKKSGDMVELLDMRSLLDPTKATIVGRYHAGEEMQDPATFAKVDLCFPSDEELPKCWLDAGYKMG